MPTSQNFAGKHDEGISEVATGVRKLRVVSSTHQWQA